MAHFNCSMMMLYTSWAERVMADDESVSHLMVFQVGSTVMMLKISQNYKSIRVTLFFLR